ncbi:MAG: alpha-hydroxy-acid oxidizing protein [Spirochaetales bacterium]|nr:alpha-hydroxy-acid oxidizing protein [Spirochaetales bacterium]
MRKNWKQKIAPAMNNFCLGCDKCNGTGCVGQIPGMGGLGEAKTFQANFNSWEDIIVDISTSRLPKIGVAPMTGVAENMGNPMSEAEFHRLLVAGAKKAGIFSCIGDGTPDHKVQDGIAALRANRVEGVVFFKPYPNQMLLQRYQWAEPVGKIIGLDIDSYRIATMAGKVVMEKKGVEQLLELKEKFKKPFIVKGIASEEDVQLIEAVRPDYVVVSNHGGRVFDNGEGIAYILQRYGERLKSVVKEVWVDGGLRTHEHLLKANALGADAVLIGRLFIQATAVYGKSGISKVCGELTR